LPAVASYAVSHLEVKVVPGGGGFRPSRTAPLPTLITPWILLYGREGKAHQNATQGKVLLCGYLPPSSAHPIIPPMRPPPPGPLVLGHEGCGAVRGAMAMGEAELAAEPRHLRSLLRAIRASLAVDRGSPRRAG